MTGLDFFCEMTNLAEKKDWSRLESLLSQSHPTLPGEREAFLELRQHETELGRPVRLGLDSAGMRVVVK